MRKEAHCWKQRQPRKKQDKEEIPPQPPDRQDQGAHRQSPEGLYLYPLYTHWKF